MHTAVRSEHGYPRTYTRRSAKIVNASMADGVPFGSYRLLRRLARGGMAEVFLARQVGVEGFERRVALKRILPHLSESEEFRVMFLDEARLAANLSHPNVVHIYDFGKVDEYYFIAMEYVDGLDLGRLIRSAKARPLPFEHIARAFADVCSGLNYAHNVTDAQGRKLNLVHRDMTPQNVLVTYDGVVKVVDFGIAKAAFAAGRTRPGVVKGKFAYMSPEQVEGRTLDGRSDIFSVGICLYETVTGVPLFRRDDVKESMREIRDGKPILPEKFRPDVPDALVSIMRKALATSRDSRYGSAAMMQLDLERYLKTAEKLGSSHHLGEYLKREFPKPPEEEAGGTKPNAIGGDGTHKQSPPTRPANELKDDSEELRLDASIDDAVTTPGKGLASALGVDDEDVPTVPDDEEMSTRVHLGSGAPQRPPAESAVKSGNTAVVPPIGANRRALVAAAVAAVTVMAAGLFAFKPWSSTREAKTVIVPVPQPGPIVTPLPVEKPKPKPAPVETPPPVETPAVPAMLDILSRPPGAHVTIDGESITANTPLRARQVQPGVHRVIVDKKGFQPRELSVTLDGNEHRTLDVELRRAVGRGVKPARPMGALTVKTVPWAKVYDGSKLLGTTPFASVPLGAGVHVLTFVNPELPPVKQTITVKEGEEAKISLALKK
jgi:serine/threonine-protein kinase